MPASVSEYVHYGDIPKVTEAGDDEDHYPVPDKKEGAAYTFIETLVSEEVPE